MGTKEKLLELLQKNKGDYFSGEDIASRLAVSRAAVWKAVNTLRKEGYAIEAATNRGYCLSPHTDVLSAGGILARLEDKTMNIQVFPSVDSTNAMARREASGGASQGLVIAAASQTAGKGRMGRSFYSPESSGVYFSLLLRPDNWSGRDALRITTMAAAAMCAALRSMGVEDVGIKWVNDIFVRGKKVCGILTEGSFSMETGLLEYAVLGVGINLTAPEGGFPEELADIAGAAFEGHGDDRKNRLVAEFLNRFSAYYRGRGSYARDYRADSLALGREVTVLSPEGERRAQVLDIDDDCRLVLRFPDGREEALSCGEIRIRL